jgi:hypothetical protein
VFSGFFIAEEVDGVGDTGSGVKVKVLGLLSSSAGLLGFPYYWMSD